MSVCDCGVCGKAVVEALLRMQASVDPKFNPKTHCWYFHAEVAFDVRAGQSFVFLCGAGIVLGKFPEEDVKKEVNNPAAFAAWSTPAHARYEAWYNMALKP